MLEVIVIIGIAGSLLYVLLMSQPRHVSPPASLEDVLRNASALHRIGHTQRALQTLIDARDQCEDRVGLEVRILEYQEYLQVLRAGEAHPSTRRPAPMRPGFLQVD